MHEKKKLILMYPNLRWHKEDMGTMWNLNPATLCLLAAMVRDIVDIEIIDAQFNNMSIEDFRKEIKAHDPDYVGLSILTSEYRDILNISAAIIKETNKDIVVIAGGVHVTTMYEYVMKDPNIDYGVIGEGEYVLLGLINYLNGEGDLPQEGLVYRKDNKLVVQGRALVHDLTKLPWPAYDLIDFKPYTKTAPREFNPQRPPESPYIRLVTTRGCAFDCVFCQVDIISGKKTRGRNPEDVVNELLFLKEKYGVRSIIFDDDNLLMAKDDYAIKLFKLMVEKQLNMKWIGIAFALFLLTDELLDLMKESGCVGINVAIESGSERVMKQIIKKPVNLKKVPGIIQRIKQRGMYCIANFVVGFVGETWNEIRETICFAERCGADYIKVFAAVPLYKTRLYEMARTSGALMYNDEFPIVDWRFAQIKSQEWTPKDISILRAYEWDRINFAPDRIHKVAEICGATLEELNIVRKKTRDNLVF